MTFVSSSLVICPILKLWRQAEEELVSWEISTKIQKILEMSLEEKQW